VAVVTFPDGTHVRAASLADRRADDHERAFGLYLDERWAPTWPADVVAWPDFGLPAEPDVAARQISDAFLRARRGELVEVGCLEGAAGPARRWHAWRFSLECRRRRLFPGCARLTGERPWETAEQEAWVQWFAGWAADDSAQ
jgi:hypothetical protein